MVLASAFTEQEPALAELACDGNNQGQRRESEQERTELTEIKFSVSAPLFPQRPPVQPLGSCAQPSEVGPQYFVCSFSPAAVAEMLRRG